MSTMLTPALRRDVGLVGWQIRYEQRAYWRNRGRGIFTFVFPLMFLVVFAAINSALDTVEPMPVDFGALLIEQASAAKLMMTVAQIIKHVDGSIPIRFLIAETETGYTLLAALWLARLFGIERHIEISPLFETAEALSAAWRKSSVRCTLGTRSLERMSRSTLPGPTLGSWSASPTTKVTAHPSGLGVPFCRNTCTLPMFTPAKVGGSPPHVNPTLKPNFLV